ncbi:hypothetical protein L227DRAFT_603174 [Lentinus tigrinus ALCF2SS1-6]|uniref:Uncharacterized protein n=2 Tax=Lentinus tigrinus TaxID=5365 RepID=A0A5C2RYS5_9APHY|nr:hypothetical protein L227DRAFT_603174 [Lentinus tigrinus ALCF2SS1-6]
MSHSPPSSPVDRGTPARTADGRGSRRSLRKRPVVEITARAKPARHAGKRVRFTTLGESSASDTEWVPSVSHESLESDGEDDVKDKEPPTKKRKRSTASQPDPPPKQTPTVYRSPTPSASDAKTSGSATRNYTRKTDRDRQAFTTLHGDIRCIFCPITSRASKPRGTIHRLPDAAARHLREFCAHFEKSHVYQQHRGADPSLSKKDIVARLVRQYEKIAVAQVHCRQNADYRRRCAALGLSPANVESRLARHAVLYKIEDCECCPLPRYSKYLASLGKSEDTMSGETKKQKKRTKQPRTYQDKETRAEEPEVIEIFDDDNDDALVKDDEVIKVKREDIKMEERGFDGAETQIEEVKEEIKEEEEEVVIREVHIKVSKSQPRVKIEVAVKQEEDMEESVKEEGEGVCTVPMTRSRRVRMKQESDP